MLTRNDVELEKKRVVIEGRDMIPVMGNLLLELIQDKVNNYKAEMHQVGGTLKDKGFEIVSDLNETPTRVPIKKGLVVDMAKDCYGERFEKNYGKDVDKAQIGDVVMFTPFQQSVVDAAGKYGLIPDEKVLGILRGD